MAQFHVRVHGKPVEDALKKLEAIPGIQTIGSSGLWVQPDKPADEPPPIEALTAVVEADDAAAAAQMVNDALPPGGAYTVDPPEPL